MFICHEYSFNFYCRFQGLKCVTLSDDLQATSTKQYRKYSPMFHVTVQRTYRSTEYLPPPKLMKLLPGHSAKLARVNLSDL